MSEKIFWDSPSSQKKRKKMKAGIDYYSQYLPENYDLLCDQIMVHGKFIGFLPEVGMSLEEFENYLEKCLEEFENYENSEISKPEIAEEQKLRSDEEELYHCIHGVYPDGSE